MLGQEKQVNGFEGRQQPDTGGAVGVAHPVPAWLVLSWGSRAAGSWALPCKVVAGVCTQRACSSGCFPVGLEWLVSAVITAFLSSIQAA